MIQKNMIQSELDEKNLSVTNVIRTESIHTKFCLQPGHADAYAPELKVTYIPGKSPELTLTDELGVFIEKIDIAWVRKILRYRYMKFRSKRIDVKQQFKKVSDGMIDGEQTKIRRRYNQDTASNRGLIIYM